MHICALESTVVVSALVVLVVAVEVVVLVIVVVAADRVELIAVAVIAVVVVVKHVSLLFSKQIRHLLDKSNSSSATRISDNGACTLYGTNRQHTHTHTRITHTRTHTHTCSHSNAHKLSPIYSPVGQEQCLISAQ